MRHRSVLEYANFRYLKLALLLCIASGAAYLWHDPPIKPYGGTWLGYTLGTIAGLLILLLLWFGIRKRRYKSRVGMVQGWLSAHVYLGASLIIVATLHTGFELGLNIHTLAYVLMMIVILSGFYGVFIYLRVPEAMTINMGNETMDSILMHVSDLDKNIKAKALNLPDDVFRAIESAINKTSLGGSFFKVVSGQDRSCPTYKLVQKLPDMTKQLKGEQAALNREVYDLILAKNDLLQRARKNMRYKALLDLWLYIHVPFSLALLAALIAHVISVFIYW